MSPWPPTLYEWAGGAPALSRLTQVFYDRVRADPLLGPVFAEMSPHHPEYVALWLGEVFGGPPAYSELRGGYAHMLGRHLGRALTEEQRARWAQLIAGAADEAGLPADPEFRSAFVAYVEWGSRIALANSQPGAEPPPRAPVPRWGWGEAPPPAPAGTDAVEPPASAAEAPAFDPSGPPGFEADIRPLFSDRDRAAMRWSFDLRNLDDVRRHANAILEQVAGGRMPCYGRWPKEQVELFRRWIATGMGA
jgi:truncated hemoglobin YjbI